MTLPVIIVGAGLAGWSTARELRKLDGATPVLLITADRGDFYAKPSLSNAFAQGRTPAQLVGTPADQMAQTHHVTLMAHTQVLAIDPARGVVTTTGGEFAYRDLVLATGAQPIRVPMAGNAADQVLSVNSLQDFEVFHARVANTHGAENRGKRVVIMGAGLIGCEFANDLAGAGYRVSVVDPAERPLAALLPASAGEALRDALHGLGIAWHFNATVAAVDQQTCGDPPALQISLSNDVQIVADIVLSAIGLRADTTLAQAAGLACERGIVVDTALQTSAAHIYALGDGAQYASAGSRTLPFVMPIMGAARALAATLAGQRTELAFPLMPVTVKTPALPIVIATPAPGLPGQWTGREPGLWQFIGTQNQSLGFVLTGPHTSRRTEQSRLVQM
ncbi:MAG TPA: FAD-dependent oxidoreductase [Rhodoferax sp.]|nr:FAD-dependent oxidoreductase [Rhodoferax sp.]